MRTCRYDLCLDADFLETLSISPSSGEIHFDALTHTDHVATTLSQALTLEFEVGEGEIQKIRAGRQDITCSAKE